MTVTSPAIAVTRDISSSPAHPQDDSHIEYNYDVVVVGAGAGGVSAAVQAARLGANVALLEETDWIGGQMTTAAVSTIDGAGPLTHFGTGIFYEFTQRVRQYYHDAFDPSKSIATCYRSAATRCFEPKVGRAVLEAMLSESGVDVYLNTAIAGALTSGNLVQGVVTAAGDVFYAHVSLDGTEYGDLIALTPARYRVGNRLSDNVQGGCVQDITYTAVVKHYPDGVPPLLDLTDTTRFPPPPGYADARLRFMTYATADGPDVPLCSGGYIRPHSWNHHKQYRGLPDSANANNYTSCTGPDGVTSDITRTVLNWANDFLGNPSTPLEPSYIENLDTRVAVNCSAKLRTVQLLYYIQNELGATDWGIANDEGFNTPYNMSNNRCNNISGGRGYGAYTEIEKHFPLLPYVRESRRIVPAQTLRGVDILDNNHDGLADKNYLTAIAVNDFGTDLHNCKTQDSLEPDLGETTAHMSQGGRVFQIPFEAVIPETVDGLLAAGKSIGTSRIANGATRLQPVEMLLGQASGTIAAIAVAAGVQPRNVSVWNVQRELLEPSSALSEFGSGISRFAFADVPLADPDWPAVQVASLYGIMVGEPPQGTTRYFGIDDVLRRDQSAVIIAKIMGLPPCNDCEQSFSDVPPSHWAFGFIEALYRGDVVEGCAANPLRFCPADLTQRAHLAVLLTKALGLEDEPYPSEPIYSDVPPSHWAFRFIQIASVVGIMDGCTATQFCPAAVVDRRQAARGTRAALDLQHAE